METPLSRVVAHFDFDLSSIGAVASFLWENEALDVLSQPLEMARNGPRGGYRAPEPFIFEKPKRGDEDYIYEEHASSDSTSDDMRIDTYEVRRLVNDGASRSDETDLSSSDTVSEVQIDPLVGELAADKAQGTHIWLIAHLRDFPVFYEPITEIPGHVTIDASDDVAADVQDVHTDRAATADTMSQPFRNFINDNDGEMGHVIDWAGAVLFSYPVDSIDSLQNAESVKFIEPADDPTAEELSTGCAAGDQDCYDDPSMPRTFSVNGLRMAEGRGAYEDSGNWQACQNSYDNCEIALKSAARGGADIEVDGTKHSGAYALTDVAAPTYFTRRTTNTEDASDAGTGIVREVPGSGSSLASPLVSGGALLVKEYMLDHGYDWVNLPGRLHVIMQSMADRWHESTDSQSSSGVDEYSGFGRFKLRPMKTGFDEVTRRWSMNTISITEESTERRSPFDTPTQHSATHIKCTLNIPQDHRETTDVTALDYFWVQMREPIDGSCEEAPAGDLVDWEFDGSDDTKYMAAITDENAVGGNCLEYVINVDHLPDELDSQMLNVFCYAGTVDDSEPN